MRQLSLVSQMLLLTALGLALTFTSVPGVFIADENQYTSYANAVRHGKFHLLGTEDLPPALGLGYFEATAPTPRPVPDRYTTPIKFSVAPLHAVIAAPFVGLGWYALVALNAFAFCFALFLVARFAKTHCKSSTAPFLAAIAFGVGSYSLEYAQGVWPHMLSLALVLGSFYLAASYRDTGTASMALLSGFVSAAAFGVRNQSLLFIPLIGLGILLLSSKPTRWKGAAAFAIGTLPLLLLYSVINHHIRDSWFPLSRGVSYFQAGGGDQGYAVEFEWILALWTKVVDFSHHPELSALRESYMVKDPLSGATMILGAIKKAWLQSSPWVGIALVGSVGAWFWRHGDEARTRELRAISLVIFPVIAAISLKGFSYGDGLSFNQRYFIELMPLAAIALVLALDRLDVFNRTLATALLLSGVLLFVSWTLLPAHFVRAMAMRLPLLLVVAALLGWYLSQKEMARWFLPAALGACIAWAGVAHLLDDVKASRRLRSENLARQQALENVIGEHTALLAFWGIKDPYGPLQLDRDLLIVDSSRDEEDTLRLLTAALLAQGRRVYVIPRMPQDKLRAITDGFALEDLGDFAVPRSDWPTPLLEVRSPRADIARDGAIP